MGRRIVAPLALVSFLLFAGIPVGPVTAGEPPLYATLDIDALGPERLGELERNPSLRWWVEIDDRLLVLAPEVVLQELERGVAVRRLEVEPAPSRLRFLAEPRAEDFASDELEELGRGGRWAVVQLRREPVDPERNRRLRPFRGNVVLARQWVNEATAARTRAEVAQPFVDRVDAQRWFGDVEALATFNRNTHQPGVLAARDWLVARFGQIEGLSVRTESFQVGGTTAYNVIATYPGTGSPDDWVLVGGHYDSTSESPSQSAPGAEDNASGCAGVLELARLLTDPAPNLTLIFICYSGEEQGLRGSHDHATGLVASGDDDKVLAMLNMDMVGYTGDSDLDCLLETEADHSDLRDRFAAAAATYTDLRIVTSFFASGSDHVPYLNLGMAALLTIANDWNSYPHYHRTTDLPEHLSLEMGGDILRMNVATVAELSHAALFEDGFEAGDLGGWSTFEP